MPTRVLSTGVPVGAGEIDGAVSLPTIVGTRETLGAGDRDGTAAVPLSALAGAGEADGSG